MSRGKNHITPPRLAEKLLLCFLKDELAEEVLGDLEEKFSSTIITKSVSRAKGNYWYQVFKYMRPFAFKNYRSPNSNTTAMFRHNLLTSYRHLLRNKLYALINILCMSLGITTLLLAITFYVFEYSYDRFYTDSKPISRVIVHEGSRTSGYLPYFAGSELAENLPDVKEVTRLRASSLKSVIGLKASPEKSFDESALAFVDTNYFDFFERKFILGSESRFTSVNNAVVLTESTAKRYFGDDNPIGEIIQSKKDDLAMEIVGIIKDFPSNSSIQLDLICSIENLKNHSQRDVYFNPSYSGFHTFIKSEPQNPIPLISQKATDFAARNLNIGRDQMVLQLEPISEVHLKSEVLSSLYVQKGDSQFVHWLVSIAIIILVMGMINYSNLSLAIAFKQVKGVGIRKAIGIRSKSIFYQLMVDTLLTCFLALILSLLLYEFALPTFQRFVQRSFDSLQSDRLTLYLLATLLCAFCGLIAGCYRAFILSRIRPVILLKGEKGIPNLSKLKAALLWVQFSLALTLISTAFYMNHQLQYVLNKDLGATVEDRLVLKNVNNNLLTLKTELLRIEGVEQAALSTFYPGMKNLRGSKKAIDFIPNVNAMDITLLGVDEAFFKLYNIDIIDSSGLAVQSLFSDKSDFTLINETTTELFNPTNPNGVKFKPVFRGQNDFIIKGTVADIHIASLHKPIGPTAFVPLSRVFSSKYLSIAYSSTIDPYELLDKIEKVYREILPTEPFESIVLEEHISQLYQEELRMRALVNILTAISLFITLNGILGMVTSNTASRMKEISIRKVLGAGFWQLQWIQNSRLLFLFLLALLVSIPIGIVAIDFWKTDFVYRISISPSLFFTAASMVILSALLVSVSLTSKASKVNPAKILRQE